MQIHSIDFWQHRHDFAVIEEHGERRTRQVLILTAITMAIEVAAGLAYGSMALLADGWHMGTHVAAFAITMGAYRFARRHATSRDLVALSIGDLRKSSPDYISMRQSRCSNKPVEPW